jgi:hypothetical protein
MTAAFECKQGGSQPPTPTHDETLFPKGAYFKFLDRATGMTVAFLAGIVAMVLHLICNQDLAGSIPVPGS